MDMFVHSTVVTLRGLSKAMIESLKAQFDTYPLDFYSHLFLLLPVAIAGYRQKFLTPALSAVALYFGLRFVEELVFLRIALLGKSNLNAINAGILPDILLVGRIYYLSFKGNRFASQLTVIATGIAFIIAILNFLSISLTSISWPIVRLLMIVLALTYFNRILAENRVRKILHHTLFWVSAGFLFYGMGTFMTSVFSEYLVRSSEKTYNVFSDMEQMISILLSVLAALGIWVSKYENESYIQPI